MNKFLFITFRTTLCVFLKHNDISSDNLARELQTD